MPVFHLDHKLVDFNNWISMFSESTLRKEREQERGVVTRRVVQDANNPNHAVVMQDASDRATMESFISDPQVQERFSDSSIFAEPPKITGGYDGEDLEAFEDGENPAFMVDHQLADYDKWQEHWRANRDQRAELWTELGCKPVRLLRDIDDRNHAIVVVLAPDKAAVEKLLSSPTAQEAFANKDVFERAPEITGQYNNIPF
jgi:quinol monooxygenase YgiN